MKKHTSGSQFWSRWVPVTRYDLIKLEDKIMAKVSELAGLLNAVSARLEKAKGEIEAEIQTLKDEIANEDLTPEAQASFDRLSAIAQGLDDLNPDVVPPPVEPPAEP
jgi:hypothetical protein